MVKILANDGISPSGKLRMEELGFEISTQNIPQEQLIDCINNEKYDALLVRSATTVRKDLIDACPGLKLIGRGGVGMDNIDVDYARDKGLHVINTPAASSQSVAELVFAHLFNMARFVYDANREMPVCGANDFKSLKKKYANGLELRGKTLGIIGFGRIGRATAKYALGCGMNVLAFDRNNQGGTVDVDLEIQGLANSIVPVPVASMEDLIAKSDFISLHVPAQANGKAVLGTEEFAAMKDGVIIVNAARGGVIDEDALIAALNSGKVAHAALDVFVNEPNPREDILKHAKVSLTPHIGAATLEAQDRIGIELADLIKEKMG